MFKKSAVIFVASFMLAACASSQPRIVQSSGSMQDINLTSGMATQVELPEDSHVRSVVVGNPLLLTAEKADNVVNLIPKQAEGETNLIVRATDGDGDPLLYQYKVTVRAR